MVLSHNPLVEPISQMPITLSLVAYGVGLKSLTARVVELINVTHLNIMSQSSALIGALGKF